MWWYGWKLSHITSTCSHYHNYQALTTSAFEWRIPTTTSTSATMQPPTMSHWAHHIINQQCKVAMSPELATSTTQHEVTWPLPSNEGCRWLFHVVKCSGHWWGDRWWQQDRGDSSKMWCVRPARYVSYTFITTSWWTHQVRMQHRCPCMPVTSSKHPYNCHLSTTNASPQSLSMIKHICPMLMPATLTAASHSLSLTWPKTMWGGVSPPHVSSIPWTWPRTTVRECLHHTPPCWSCFLPQKRLQIHFILDFEYVVDMVYILR